MWIFKLLVCLFIRHDWRDINHHGQYHYCLRCGIWKKEKIKEVVHAD